MIQLYEYKHKYASGLEEKVQLLSKTVSQEDDELYTEKTSEWK